MTKYYKVGFRHDGLVICFDEANIDTDHVALYTKDDIETQFPGYETSTVSYRGPILVNAPAIMAYVVMNVNKALEAGQDSWEMDEVLNQACYGKFSLSSLQEHGLTWGRTDTGTAIYPADARPSWSYRKPVRVAGITIRRILQNMILYHMHHEWGMAEVKLKGNPNNQTTDALFRVAKKAGYKLDTKLLYKRIVAAMAPGGYHADNTDMVHTHATRQVELFKKLWKSL